MTFQEYYEVALRHGWFDPCFYFDRLQSAGLSCRDSGLSLFEHYATIGWTRGLSPSDRFSVPRYLAENRYLADRNTDPLYHHLVRGQWEQRKAFAVFEDTPDEVQFVGLIETIDDEIAVAQAHGISAFCMRHDEKLRRDAPARIDAETPFCLVLDGRNWARLPRGGGALEAQYGFIHDLLDVFGDPRHLRVRGKPLLVVRGLDLLEDPRLTLELWREVARSAGFGGLFVAGLTSGAGSVDDSGLDAIIGAAALPAAPNIPVFPGFLADGSALDSPEAFRAWLPSAAERTQALARLGLPQLVFIDARNRWADGTQAFLNAGGPRADRERLGALRRFAQGILVSPRVPVLFLGDEAAGAEQSLVRRLNPFLGQSGRIECFLIGDVCEPGGAGWTRARTAEALARWLTARGDLVVVAGASAPADMLLPFADHGHRIASLSPSIPTQVRDDGHVLPLPAEPRETASWPRYAEEIQERLSRLGNEGRRIRLTGSTLGRQEIADDLCVVIPSYNHKRFILAALDSILAQSLRPKEIRIIDDGSDDGSGEVVRSLACPELGIIVQARQNRGASATINQGFAETECPIVAVMNSDDRWHPLRIEALIGDLRRKDGADVVFSRIRFLDPERRSDDKRVWYERGIADYGSGTPMWLALMFCNFFFTTSNLIVRRDKFLELGGFGPLRYFHDLDYMLRAIFAGHKVKFAEQALCEYRLHASNTIDEDMRKLLREEAWVVAKFMAHIFGRISDEERSMVAQRACDKNLATRVLAILRATAGRGVEFDDKLIHTEPHFGETLEPGPSQLASPLEPGEFLDAMTQLISVARAG